MKRYGTARKPLILGRNPQLYVRQSTVNGPFCSKTLFHDDFTVVEAHTSLYILDALSRGISDNF